MPVSCSECGGATAWDDDAGSAICTTCGTLTDPSQSILTSTTDNAQQSYNPALPPSGIYNPSIPPALKSFRAGPGWNLAGQSTKDSRDAKNHYAMAEFINSLARSLNAQGVAPRATTLFAQGMNTGRFHWGRKARLLAGACLALALRDSSRPDLLHDIAALLSEPYSALARMVAAATHILHLAPSTFDPKTHIPSIHLHLSSVLAQDESQLPTKLVTQLKSISLRLAANIAHSICTLPVTFPPGPPTSCAIFILALEAESRVPLAKLTELATHLGVRFHTSRSIIMERYKFLQDQLSALIQTVPWLRKYERTKCGRAKLGKRAVVARGLQDVIQFQEEIRESRRKPTVCFETNDADEDDSELLLTYPKKRQKIHNPLSDAAHFLLDPISAPIPQPQTSITAPQGTPIPHALATPVPLSSPGHDYAASSATLHSPATPYNHSPSIIPLPLISYILSAPSLPSSSRPPTRLQILLASRNNVGDTSITDEELFAPGELEGMLRTSSEVEALKRLLEWDEEDDFSDTDNNPLHIPQETGCSQKIYNRKGKRKAPAEKEEADDRIRRKRSKINLEALALFLEDYDEAPEKGDYEYALAGLESFDQCAEDNKEEDVYDGKDDDDTLGDDRGRSATPSPIQTRDAKGSLGEVVVDEWRPLSPRVSRFSGAGSRWEEEYD